VWRVGDLNEEEIGGGPPADGLAGPGNGPEERR
jgi:hypothetical protein